MSLLALELDDRALSIARDGCVLGSAPSAVLTDVGSVSVGTPAWDALCARPTATSTQHLGSLLYRHDLSRPVQERVKAELAQRLAECHAPTAGEAVWVGVPARSDEQGLGALLNVSKGLLHIEGFIDSAVAIVGALGLEKNAVVLELGLHHAAATAVDAQGGHARRRRSIVSEQGGLIDLYRSWLGFISTAMVNRTRFDPLHGGATEQQLFQALPELARAATTTGVCTAAVVQGAERFEVAITRDQFAASGAPIWLGLSGLVHPLRPAGMPIALVVSRQIAEFPGLRDELEQFVGCELILIPDGFAAAAISLLDLPQRSSEESARLLRRLPLQEQPQLATSISSTLLGKQRSAGPAPSHVLLDGRAYSLDARELVVGRAPGQTPSIVLPADLAGVSRRHCTFTHDGSELVLLDHSTFGTLVNGERVLERVRVHAGDRVRLGEPGIELSLIAVGELPPAAS